MAASARCLESEIVTDPAQRWSPKQVAAAGLARAADLAAAPSQDGERVPGAPMGPVASRQEREGLAPSRLTRHGEYLDPVARLCADLLAKLDLTAPLAPDVRTVLVSHHRSAKSLLEALHALALDGGVEVGAPGPPPAGAPSERSVRRGEVKRRRDSRGSGDRAGSARAAQSRGRFGARYGRSAGGVIAVLSLVVLAAVAGWRSARPASVSVPGPQARPSLASPVVPWAAVVAGIDRARVRGLAGMAPLSLAEVPASPAARVDGAHLSWLRARDLHPAGLVFRVLAVQPAGVRGDRAVVMVSDEASAYRLVSATGRPAFVVEARAARWWRETLIHDGAGWRLFSVTPAPPPAPLPAARSGT